MFTFYARDVPKLIRLLENRFNNEIKEFVNATWQQVPEAGTTKSSILRIAANAKTQKLFSELTELERKQISSLMSDSCFSGLSPIKAGESSQNESRMTWQPDISNVSKTRDDTDWSDFSEAEEGESLNSTREAE